MLAGRSAELEGNEQSRGRPQALLAKLLDRLEATTA